MSQVLLSFLVACSSAILWTKPIGQKLDFWVLRQCFEFRGARPVPEEVIILAIDDLSYQKLGLSPRWPFPRKVTAQILEALTVIGPKTLIIDAQFPREDSDPIADARIAKALQELPVSIFSGNIPSTLTHTTETITLASDPRFRSAAKFELPMLLPNDYGYMARIAAPKGSSDLFERVPIAKPLVLLGGMNLVAPGNTDLINYYGPAGTIPRLSVHEIVRDASEASVRRLKDKVVFLGIQSIGFGRSTLEKDEYFPTVSSTPMFGVEIHANVAGNLIERSWLKRFRLTTEVFVIFLACLMISVSAMVLTPDKAYLSSLLVVIFYAGIVYSAFARGFWWIPGTGVLTIAAFSSLSLGALYHYVVLKKFQKYIEKTFNFEFEQKF